jgi:hypothetical protein
MPDHDHIPSADGDPELTGTLRALSALAEADRSEPDAGFEARLAASARPGVVAHVGAQTRPARPAWWWAIPVAAAASLSLLFLPTRAPAPEADPPAMTLASIESDLEAFLFIDDLASSSAALTDLSLDASSDESTPADELIFDLLATEGSTL